MRSVERYIYYTMFGDGVQDIRAAEDSKLFHVDQLAYTKRFLQRRVRKM